MRTFQKWGVLADFSNMENIGTTTAEVVNVTTATTIAMTVKNQETDDSTKETVTIGWQIRNAREEIVTIFYILQTKEERK